VRRKVTCPFSLFVRVDLSDAIPAFNDGQRVGSPVAGAEKCARQFSKAGLQTHLRGGVARIVMVGATQIIHKALRPFIEEMNENVAQVVK